MYSSLVRAVYMSDVRCHTMCPPTYYALVDNNLSRLINFLRLGTIFFLL